MKSLNLYAIGDLRYEDVPMPKRETGEVLMKVRAAGICGSDVPRVFTKGTYHFPTIPGHEFAGEIIEADRPELVGRRAAVFPLLPCRKCTACQIGEYAQCEDYDYYGSRRDGAFAEYIAVKEWNLILFDDNLSYEEAAMCEPAAVALHAMRQGAPSIGSTVAVFGAGPIGLMLGQWAKIAGASQVVLCDIDPLKVEFAKNMGFRHVVNSMESDPVEYIKNITEGKGAEVCIEGAGAAITWEQCMKSAATFGRVVCMGNPSREMTLTQKGYWEILRKQLTLVGTWNSNYNDSHNDWKTALDAIASGKLHVKELISHRFDFSEGEKAFGVMTERKEFFNKVMFVNE